MKTLVQRFSVELKKQSLDGADKKLQLTRIGLIGVKFDNAIVLYFQCKSNTDLTDLKTAFDNGEIKSIAESYFGTLLSRDDQRFAAMFKWSQEDYKRCDNYMRLRPFSDRPTCIDDLLMDVLEIILTKAYALYFFRVQPGLRDKELFSMLSSISRYWHKTISRPCRFKAALNRRLYPYYLSVTKRQTIIRSNRQYLVEHLEPSSNLIWRLEQVGCLTSEEANYIESLHRNSAKNDKLLTVVRTMSLEKHIAFVESLHFCGQLKVANVLEKGGVVFKTTAICAGVSINAEFIKRLNEQIPKTDREYFKLRPCTGLFEVGIPNELEMLEVQPLGRRKGKTHIVIWLWCKSQKSSRRLCKLADSDRLIKLLDILMTFIWSKSTQHLNDLIQSWSCDTYTLQFLKTLSLNTMLFQRAVVVRQLSVKFSGEFVLPRNSRAITILDDKVYVLTDAEIWVHQYMAPYARQFKTVFPPPSESLAVYPDYRDIDGCFIEACHHAKCIYGVRSHDQRIWKFTTPEYNLEVWMHYLATLCSLSVTSNGNVLILKYEGQGLADGAYCLEMYTKDAVLVYNINLDMPSLVMRPESPSVLEISPGNFAIKCRNTLLVKSVNFDTLTTTDQNRIQYPYIERKPDHGHMGSIALYSVNRLIAVLNSGLAILDSRLNAEIILNSSIGHADALHYRKDKRQLMACSSGMKSLQIYTLQYEGEDLAENCALEVYE